MQTGKFYIDGVWTDPVDARFIDVINPATEEAVSSVALGSAADVDKAVAAARRAFETFSQTGVAGRLALLKRILEEYNRRMPDLAAAMTMEMGAPVNMSESSQAWCGQAHIETTIKVLEDFVWEKVQGPSLISYEPIGVCGFITPWNWPMNQIASKVAPALAAGCTMILKPSEIAPLNAIIFAEILEAAGVPAGVFNLVQGDGPGVGAALSAHPGIDMISFTGSTRAGIEVARSAAYTVKRVAQELGGKSANILLEHENFAKAVRRGVNACFDNSGQSCNAPTRMFVPSARMEDAKIHAKAAAEALIAGDPLNEQTNLGPVVSRAQYDKIQGLIEKGIAEGATLVTGGPGLPVGLNRGYYVRPTVFADVDPSMTIAREEIFGPVLSILGYDSVDDAVRMANDTEYGLAAYVQGDNLQETRDVARRLRAGRVKINNGAWDPAAPFGGYKQSGNGREFGTFGFHEFLEVKATLGYTEA